MTTRRKSGPAPDFMKTVSAAIAASTAASDPVEPEKVKSIGIRMPESLHTDLSDISHFLRRSLNSLLLEGSEAMRTKYLQQAQAERDKR